MNQFSLQSFINEYGLFTIISAVVISLILEAVCLLVKDKRIAFYDYLPFILGILSELIYGLISFGADMKFEKFFYSGLLCGSLSEIIKTVADKILTGKTINFDSLSLYVEGVIADYVIEDNLTILIKEIIALLDFEDAESKIKEVLNENLKKNEDSNSIDRLVYLIMTAKKTLKLNGKNQQGGGR